MKTSVIIPTYSGGEKLATTVKSLCAGTARFEELIIVVDNDDAHVVVPDHTVTKTGTTLIVIRQKNSGRAAARNAGASAATSGLLLFIDDDMICSADLVSKHVQFHETNPACILSGSGFRNPAEAKSGFDRFIIRQEESWRTSMIAKGEVTFEKFSFTACNLSLPREVFSLLRGFDEELSDAEDLDFGVRALQKDIRVFYDGGIIAFHNDFPSPGDFIRRSNEYAKARTALLRLRPDYQQLLPSLVIPKNGPLKRFFLRIAKKTVCRGVLENGPLFRLLPLRMKFFFYRLTLSAFSVVNE
ncbi:MAG TPA: glycosyltransferase [Bacteroidia bacterium]|nr:glycosyltransferase [Bacteroidia bacterium]